ncbi:cell division protein FtsW [Lysinibacillus sphaericus]|uniref:FtsW/RodA/SpoVE family cell cycle protein n=1 Tax=Lysinibacillus sphaericus TaxID=1421 RepID=UPI0018CD61DB|nr:FtsW/RodA/SpoVE family cell cycle protein [Lysinibacillus sphaericus]MBG9454661.1 cell division protein FtsW [Lysinibacillus sphaericus]MBG9478090.1 cell division protein FtsW [Lysinibacillus sphaericus]MBG9590803.1 cell division protein FtsW [Lysinibacillus sphaericus]
MLQFNKLDKNLVISLSLLGIISCLFVHSSSTVFEQYTSSFIIKQLFYYLIGFFIMYGVATLDIEQLKKIGWPFYWAMVLLTFGLFIAPESIARTINEAKRWYHIPVLGSIQPSEFLKLAFLIVVSKVIVAHREKYVRPTFLTDMWLLLIIAVITLPPTLAVYKQPDTGMVMLYMSMIVPMLFFSGIQRKLLIIFTAIPVSILSVMVILYVKFNNFFTDKILNKLSGHQISRIYGWLQPNEYPDSSFQTRQGFSAIGSGQFTGKGYMNNDVYVVEKHTDFIFANIAEELGFVGGAFVIVLLFFVIYRIVLITVEAKDPFMTLMGAGIASLLAFQITQNIGMTIGLLPVTGMTLPFLSYGGSSLISNFMLMGIVMIIYNSYSGYMFKTTKE